MKKLNKFLELVILSISLCGCAKSTDKLVEEQLKISQKYISEQNYEQAYKECEKAIEIASDNMAVYREVITYFVDSDNVEMAFKIMIKARETYTNLTYQERTDEQVYNYQLAAKKVADLLWDKAIAAEQNEDYNASDSFYDSILELDGSRKGDVAKILNERAKEDKEIASADDIIPYSDQMLLKDSYIINKGQSELTMALNEIYARHGKRFNDIKIQEYFESRPWYEAGGYSDNLLNDIERYNIQFLEYRINNAITQIEIPENYTESLNMLKMAVDSSKHGARLVSDYDGRTKIYDCGSTWMLTDMKVEEWIAFDNDFVNRLSVGGTIEFNGQTLVLVNNISNGYGELKIQKDGETELIETALHLYYMQNEDVWVLASENNEIETSTIYSGDVFIEKDCRVEILSNLENVETNEVDAFYYLAVPKDNTKWDWNDRLKTGFNGFRNEVITVDSKVFINDIGVITHLTDEV